MRFAWSALTRRWSQLVWKRRVVPTPRRANFGLRLEELEQRALLAVYTIPAAADGVAVDLNLDGVFDNLFLGVTTVDSQLSSDPNIGDQRGITEFNLSSIPANERISSVVFRVDIVDFAVGTGYTSSLLKFFGGMSDGAVTLDDLKTSNIPVRDLVLPTTYAIDPGTSDARYDIALSPSLFQSLLGTSSFVSVVSQMLTPGSQFLAHGHDYAAVDPLRGSRLIITTTSQGPALTVTVNAPSVSEDRGPNATTLTITRTGDLSAAVVVNLSSSDPSEATVPASVIIPAHAASVQVPVDAVDDMLLDGPQGVRFVASFALPLNGAGPPMADPTFGGENGMPILGAHGISGNYDPNVVPDASYAKVIVQPDGKTISIVAPDGARTSTGWILTRLNVDGSYDSTFGVNGVVTTLFPNVFLATYSGLTLQSDGKIVVAGGISPNGDTRTSNWLVVRYNPDGSVDGGFGVGGVLTDNLTPGPASVAKDVLQLADGKLLVGGVRDDASGGTSYSLTRYLANGSVDTSFGAGGFVMFDAVLDAYDVIHQIAIQADGKIVVVGVGDHYTMIGVARFNTDGSLDTSFANSGFRSYTGENYYAIGEAVAIQPDGKIVIAARTYDFEAAVADLYVMRLNPNGNLDTSFHSTGTDKVKMNSYRTGVQRYSLAIQADGRIIVAGGAGSAGAGSLQVPTLIRYMPDGSRDTSFGPDGFYQPTARSGFFAATGAAFMSVAWQPDGQLVALAASRSSAYVVRFGSGSAAVTSISNTLTVADSESLSMTLSRTSVSEAAGGNAVFGTVTRSNTDIAAPLDVFVFTSDSTAATVPAKVTIPAGESSVAFDIGAVDDLVIDTDQPVTIRVSAPGYAEAARSLLVTDNETAGAIYTGDILVSRPGTDPNTYEIAEFTPTGSFVHAIAVPWAGGGSRPNGQSVRDLVQDQNGKLYLFNGTTTPFLTAYDPISVAFANQSFAGWSGNPTGGAGGIATYHQFLFVSDSNTPGTGVPAGIVRFDRTDNSVVRFSNSTGYQDLTIGLDRLLYALNQNQHIDVYDPTTMTLLRSIDLPAGDYRGIAVKANGEILAAGANGTIYQFNAAGVQQKSLVSGAATLTDIDVEPGGRVLAGSQAGEVVITNVSLASATKFTASTTEVFVAFAIEANFPVPTIGMTPTPLRQLESDPPASIDSDLVVTDDGTELIGATVTFSNGYIQGLDQLIFVNQNGITGTFNSSLGKLTLSGVASINNYRAALRSVLYSNASDTPTVSRNVTLTVTDGVNSASATRTILLTPINDSPAINPHQVFVVPENAPNNTPFGTVTAFDAESSPLSGYAIVSGNLTNLFAIDPATGVLRVSNGSQLNFESQRTYVIGVVVTDGLLPSAVQTVTINLQDQNDNSPFIQPGQDFTVSENSPNAVVVGRVEANDIDTVGSFQGFTIVAGNSQGIWAIDPLLGELTVANGSLLDFETKPTHVLSIQVSDGVHISAIQTIQIHVSDQNDVAPVITPGLIFFVPENSLANTTAGTVTATDVDAFGTLQKFAIVSGNNSGAWSIDPVSGLIKVNSSIPLNFEATPMFTLGVTVSDGVQTSAVQIVTINLTNVNEIPSLAPAIFSIPEESTGGLFVGTIQGTDPDLGQTLTYTVTAGSTENKFLLDPTTGIITVKNGATFDFETTPSYSFVVTVTDSGSPAELASAQVTITLTNGNDPPIITPSQTFFIAENSSNLAQVGMVDARDADVGQTLIYSLIAGNPNVTFTIDPSTGRITVANSSLLDFETTKSFNLTVKVTDNGTPNLSAATPVTIVVTNVNEGPSLAPATFTVVENSPKTTLVGSLSGLDPDVGQSLGYFLIGGNTGNAFSVHLNLGIITVNNPAAIDFETNPTFTLTVKIQDNGSPSLFSQTTVTIHLTDVLEAPRFVNQSFNVDEGASTGATVGTVVASDPDQGLPVSYYILDGDPNGIFTLDPVTGILKIANGAALDYETQPFLPLLIQVTKPGSPPLTTSATVTVNVGDVNEPPIVGNATFGIQENSADGTLVGTLQATDPDLGQSLFCTIINGDTNNAFQIDATTGELRVADSSKLDFEAVADYVLSVQVTDSGFPALSKVSLVTVHVNDVNEPPVLGDQSITIPENPAVGAILGTMTALNPESSQELTYSIIAGNSNNALAIDPSTGQIRIAPNGSLNFEVQPLITLTVQVVDHGQPAKSDTGTFTIHLTNVNEPPHLTPVAFSLAENSPVGTVVGTIVALDDDSGQHTSYAITASDLDGLFALSPNGVLTIALPNLLDFETHPIIHFTVTTSDDGSPPASESKQFTVQLTNVDEPPEIVLAPGDRTLSIPVKPQVFDSQIRVRDADTPSLSLANTTVQVKVIDNASSFDKVTLLKSRSGDLVIKGENVIFQGTVIGERIIGKKGGVPLTIRFNGQVTQAGVEAALRKISYVTKGAAGSTRTLEFSLSGAGGGSPSKTTKVVKLV